MGGVFGEETFVSFTHYAADPVVSLTIAFLIIIGGLGFCVWGDIVDNKGNVKKFRLHTKVVLLVNTLCSSPPPFSFYFSNATTPPTEDFPRAKMASRFFQRHDAANGRI